MKTVILSALALLLTLTAADPFNYLPFFEYASSLGYPVEDHVVPTEDHYNLRFYRIQGTKKHRQPKTAQSQQANE